MIRAELFNLPSSLRLVLTSRHARRLGIAAGRPRIERWWRQILWRWL